MERHRDMSTTVYHPRPNQFGASVKLSQPSIASSPDNWHQPNAVACVTPDGPMPEQINGIAVAPWLKAPETNAAWERLASATEFPEPPFQRLPGLKSAAGVVIQEPDGRVWVVSPSNGFGGYQATFPKGTVEGGLSLTATAIKESFEETGLCIELSGHLLDVVRTTSVTRYYRARRLGGHPAMMCWETQAVHLVPCAELPSLLTHASDHALIELLTRCVAE